MSKLKLITKVWAREVLNFRGNPTVEAEVFLSDGSFGRAAVPAGVSTGTNEVVQLIDNDTKRFGGKGVLIAVQKVREVIAPALKGMPAFPQEDIDKRLLELDGTLNKSNLGGNAILAVSLAAAYAAAYSQNLPLYRYLGGEGPFQLPVPLFNMFCGGSHAENSVDFQEYLVIPAGYSSFREALQAGVAIYKSLIDLLKEQGYIIREVGGPITTSLDSNQEGIEVIITAIERAGYKVGEQCFVGLDAATSELYENGKYILSRDGLNLTSSGMADFWEKWISAYPIVSIEDAMSEEDWEGWQDVTKRLADRIQLVGDDLFTTNPERVRRGIGKKTGNAVLIKPNQIGTLTETLETIHLAHRAGWANILSTRSGETEDTAITDLSVLENCGQIKTGAPCRQNIVKHNRLLRIEEELGSKANYAGLRAFRMLH